MTAFVSGIWNPSELALSTMRFLLLRCMYAHLTFVSCHRVVVDTLRPEESETGKIPTCLCLAWSADGSTLFAGYSDHLIRVYHVTAL